MKPSRKLSFAIINAYGKATKLKDLLYNIVQCGCNINTARAHSIGEDIMCSLFIGGSWNAIAKIEVALPNIEIEAEFSVQIKRIQPPECNYKYINYSIQSISLDKPGLLYELVSFFQTQEIHIEDIVTNTYNTNSNNILCAINLLIRIPEYIHIPTVREKFINLCDTINIDAGMEPIRDP